MIYYKLIEGFTNYAVSTHGVVYKADRFYAEDAMPLNFDGQSQVISPYYSERDNVLYVNLFNEKGRLIKSVHKLVADAFLDNPNNGVAICRNGDYRNCQLDNILFVPRGKAIQFKKAMFSTRRYDDFYMAFLSDPRPETYYSMPVDVQEYIKGRGVVEWQPKMYEYPNNYTSS